MGSIRYDISAMREQILSNVSVAIPLISRRDGNPGIGPDDRRYTIITKAKDSGITAVVVYGPTNKVFAFGEPDKAHGEAMKNLLDTTEDIVAQLFVHRDLETLREEDTTYTRTGGYNAYAGC